MSPRANEHELIEKLKADIAAREAKLVEKDNERKRKIAHRIEAKEELIRKTEAEILKLREEIGEADVVIDTGNHDVQVDTV